MQRKEQGEQGCDGGCLGKPTGAVSHRSRQNAAISWERCWPVKCVNTAGTFEKPTETRSWSPQMFLLLEVQQPAALAVRGEARMRRSCQKPSTGTGKKALGSSISGCGGVYGGCRSHSGRYSPVKQPPGRVLVPASGVAGALPRRGVYCAGMVCGFACERGPLPKRGCKITEGL